MTTDPPRTQRGRPFRGAVLGRSLGLNALLGLVFVASSAQAQNDVFQPPPNVLLLVDTSGSMEYRRGSNQFPSCKYTTTTDTGFDAATNRQTSRWIDLVEVLTGTIQNYQCQKFPRNTSFFDNIYKAASPHAYDFLYTNPYHRPLSGSCAPGPGADPLPAGQFVFDNPATSGVDEGSISYRQYDNPSSQTCAFAQDPDGVLDAFRIGVRFGLMTFDTHPSPSAGVSGLWSYIAQGTSSTKGMPLGCIIPQDQEVGARNPLAPAWEGRLVGFGDPNMGSTDYQTRNDQIQRVLAATRPYGATPIAGMLEDARSFLLTETATDPQNSSLSLGPRNDPLNQCPRSTSIILLSDGTPNMDLRPDCDDADPNGCPFDRAEEVAADLASSVGHEPIPVHVIGFGISSFTVNGNPTSCSAIDTGSSGPCASSPDQNLQACCALSRIAVAGGNSPTAKALFPDDRDELRSALASILSKEFSSSSRTQPVSGPGMLGKTDFAAAVRFFAGFASFPFQSWGGQLERQRWRCLAPSPSDPKQAEPVAINPQLGDDFVANVNSGIGPKRLFISVKSAALNGSATSLRPQLSGNPNDGLGTLDSTQYVDTDKDFADATIPEQMNITAATCTGLTAADCKKRYLYWLVGLNNGTINHRCPRLGDPNCRLVGDIFHSTPRLVGAPGDLVVDESYRQFAFDNAKRPMVLYVSTNDGFLHAFKVASGDPGNDTEDVDSLRNNELWAFIPPAILPALPLQYPAAHQVLLDGSPVVKDVVATTNSSAAAGKYKFKLERTLADAESGGGTWRTILIQSFGAERPGYFALDVTDPIAVEGDPTKGPQFLWQITNDLAGNPLFGLGGATPLITTVFLGGKETAVAVLPGGRGSIGGPGPGTGCDRAGAPFSIDTTYPPRTKLPCYSGAGIKARSLTIVRLDTGEIIRTFRQAASEVTLPAGLVNLAKFDSPITGQPVAFPADVGAVADRLFVGDQDGTMWKVNLSSNDPANWNVSLFFDAYSKIVSPAYNVGQPITTPPILSVNDRRDVTVNFSTGDQDALGTAPGMKNYVWSLTEAPDVLLTNGDISSFKTNVNWYRAFDDGERVTGPIVLFNTDLFFSTFKPLTDMCKVGQSRIWSMDYIEPVAPTTRDQGGAVTGRLPGHPNDVFVDVEQDILKLPSGVKKDVSAVFGVSLAQEPTCFDADPSTDNQYLSYLGHTGLSNVVPGAFNIVFNPGAARASADATGDSAGGALGGMSITVAAPPTSSHIDSWAAIVE